MGKVYDSVIIGAGPAGISTAIYNSRAGMSTALVERGLYGGTLHDTDEIENYTSYTSISGPELAKNMEVQAKEQIGVDHIYGNVKDVFFDGEYYSVYAGKKTIRGKTIVIATGVKYKEMGIKGEDIYKGRGISNCVTCDVNFFRGKEILMIGGGDSAVEGALYASNIVDKVTLVHRRDELRADKISQYRLFEKENIDIIWNAETIRFEGSSGVFSGITYKDKKTNKEYNKDANGAFINIGIVPVTEPFKKLVELDQEGYIITNSALETSAEGVFAVGDVREDSIRQIVNATADGALASKFINKYLESKK